MTAEEALKLFEEISKVGMELWREGDERGEKIRKPLAELMKGFMHNLCG